MNNKPRVEYEKPILARNDVRIAAEQIGIKEGDTVLIHSSYKSIGPIENGAESIVYGFLDTVGKEGTIVFPTLCQADWNHVYENWYMDAPSDVGYLTNYFRKLPSVSRSNQATHSVAALGKNAKLITQTHGESGLRWGIFGSTPFSSDSPWEKMYHLNVKVILIGVGIRKCTFRHYAEYVYMNELLSRVRGHDMYESLKTRMWCYERWEEKGAWPHVNNEFVQKILDAKAKITYGKCGKADMICFNAKDFVNETRDLLEKEQWEALSFDAEILAEWVDDVKKAT